MQLRKEAKKIKSDNFTGSKNQVLRQQYLENWNWALKIISHFECTNNIFGL